MKTTQSSADLKLVPAELAEAKQAISRWASMVELAGKSRDWTRAQTAEYLGISFGYFSSLLAGGGSSQTTIGRKVIEKSAELLDTSVLNVELQAGMLQLSDLYSVTDHEKRLEKAYDTMVQDVEISTYLPTRETWGKMTINERYGICLMFTRATEKFYLEQLEILAPG